MLPCTYLGFATHNSCTHTCKHKKYTHKLANKHARGSFDHLESPLRGRNKSLATGRPKLYNVGFLQYHKRPLSVFLSPALPCILKARFASQVSSALPHVLSSTLWVFNKVTKARFAGFQIPCHTSQAPFRWFSTTSQKPASRVFKSRANRHLKNPLCGLHNVS